MPSTTRNASMAEKGKPWRQPVKIQKCHASEAQARDVVASPLFRIFPRGGHWADEPSVIRPPAPLHAHATGWNVVVLNRVA